MMRFFVTFEAKKEQSFGQFPERKGVNLHTKNAHAFSTKDEHETIAEISRENDDCIVIDRCEF